MSGFPFGTWHAAPREGGWSEWQNECFFPSTNPRGFFFLYIGNSVFVDPVRGPNKTLNKNILLLLIKPQAILIQNFMLIRLNMVA